ncbi:MAG TPA: exodeoxyribonuclease VII small subunit [Isosphaeraceae bacterium]|jgi:exodeoxyribonuclease VII small subunit|nr:exodeoxyribonuclease VII small subunit [Isosphaeraceae bacterium]
MLSTAKIDAAGFEAAVQQLEQTVSDLENGDLGLDLALAKYELGVQLLTHCYGLLGGAERVVSLLKGVDAEGNPVTSPFDATATADREVAVFIERKDSDDPPF